ncbi:hypothetical protein BHE74_00015408 [Ensete ventricosum]|nr:hypothetical protein BHE74_00015408 [Ensete ventricosum]
MDETRCAACRSQPSVEDPGNRAWSISSRCRPSIQTVRSILGKSCSVDAELAGFERLANSCSADIKKRAFLRGLHYGAIESRFIVDRRSRPFVRHFGTVTCDKMRASAMVETPGRVACRTGPCRRSPAVSLTCSSPISSAIL